MAVFDKWEFYDAIGWEPHAGQLRVVESEARHRVVAAGRRYGKSDIGGHELLAEAFYTRPLAERLKELGKRREFWIVGPEYSDAEKEFRVTWNNLVRLGVPMDKPGSYYDAVNGNLHISLWGGAFQVHGKSAKYPDTLVGEGLSGVIMAEAAKIKERVWTKYIRPTLADFDGWSIHSSTPEGKNHFYEKWQMGQDPGNPKWWSTKSPAWHNHYVYKTPTDTQHVRQLMELSRNHPKLSVFELARENDLIIDSEILDLAEDLTVEAFLQEIGAEFTEFVGRVFKEFDEETHVGDLEWQPNWQTYGAVDYGYTNPNVWLLIQVGPWGEINVLDECYEPGLDATEFADEIQRRNLCPFGTRSFFPDPASPGDTRILERKLRIRGRGNTGGELRYRIDAIRKALKTLRVDTLEDPATPGGAWRPQMMIDRKCTRTISDMNEYRYPEKKEESSTKAQELPMKKDDHAPEALGRFFKGLWGTPQDQASSRRTAGSKFTRAM